MNGPRLIDPDFDQYEKMTNLMALKIIVQHVVVFSIRALARFALTAFLAMAGTACHGGAATFSSQITGYNHTDKTIGSFSVNGSWGGNVTPHSGGGDTCCLELPLPWHKGLTVKIEWEDDTGQQHTRDVTVPQYDPKSLGIFNVHFLRSGEIKVFAINAGLGHPDYPLQGDEANLKPGVPNFQFPRERPASDGAAGKSAKGSI